MSWLPIAGTSYQNQILKDSSLVGFWRLDERGGYTFADSKGGNTATIKGTVTSGVSTSYLVGDTSTASTFDGSSGYASIGDVSDLNIFTRTQPFTITAIIKPNVTRSGVTTDYWIYSKQNPAANFNGLMLGIRWLASSTQTAGSTGLIVQFGSNFPTQYIHLWNDQDLLNGVEYLVSVTYDGTGVAAGFKLYIDGVAIPAFDDAGSSSQTIAAGQVTTAVGFAAEIGRRGTLNKWFKGNIKDVAIFNVAKSATWMQALVFAANASKGTNFVVNSSVYTPNVSPRPQVIYDLDHDSDAGDTAEMVMMLNLEHQGLLDLAAVIVTSTNTKAAPAAYAVMNYYGRTSIPTGANTTNSPGNSVSPNSWVQTVATNFSVVGFTDASNFPTATTVLRTLLAGAPNNSLDWVTNGDLGSVQLLLQSGADGISSLTGLQLITQKIKSIWIVGGNWPSGEGVSDISGSSAISTVSSYVFLNWPITVPMILVSITEGNQVQYGSNVMVGLNSLNPARLGWITFFGNSNTSNIDRGWSSIAFLSIVYGLGTYLTIAGANGTAAVNTSTNVTNWTQSPNSGHAWVVKATANTTLGAATDALIIDHASW